MRRIFVCALAIASQIVLISCGGLEKPQSEPYYAGTAPPRKQEFRWSNGRMPKNLDPALAAVPPETDVIRAVYEGLTELDTRTLEPMPAVAEKWTVTEDLRTWTFQLRNNARWSNGRSVTAEDFVRSWKRVEEFGAAATNRELMANIVGFEIRKREAVPAPSDLIPNTNVERGPQSPFPMPTRSPSTTIENSNVRSGFGPEPIFFGVSAPDALTLRVSLTVPDKDFPKLVAHPMFRPVFDDGSGLATRSVTKDVVTNGAFRVASIDPDGIMLLRSENYWNREAVKLESAKLVSSKNAEQVLAAYRAGEIDAITNAEFEPLALKLLEPFEDFRRRTHAALNFYEINHGKSPFDDRRVREALAISIERERLTEGEMDGLTTPALAFLPFSGDPTTRIVHDKERAADLLEEAGFANGSGFPVVRLVVNRNDTQLRVARAVARMWKQSLNINTEVVVKEPADLEIARTAGDYDLIRRNVVYASADELMSILTIFKPAEAPSRTPGAAPQTAGGVEARPAPSPSDDRETPPPAGGVDSTMTEANAVYELWAIPLYFPTSYSLVKPYVDGFEMNSLDAPLLTQVSIDSNWQPK
ncbi:MAG: peptide ABC transporter substrate-binding protein [Blastocatellia bacterium]|nr:peptide ABC transporter substrate-binding protein [Blastocatellia bacterium]